MTTTAILVDGAFFLKRYRWAYGKGHSPQQVAKNLFTMCIKHLEERNDLYRILFYDCPPLSKKAHNPVNGKAVDFSKTKIYAFRTQLHKELVRLRKVALRSGRLSEKTGGWVIKPDTTKRILSGTIQPGDISENDVEYDVTQKGVDMKIGLDIASLAFKRLVGRIILVTGDADFGAVWFSHESTLLPASSTQTGRRGSSSSGCASVRERSGALHRRSCRR